MGDDSESHCQARQAAPNCHLSSTRISAREVFGSASRRTGGEAWCLYAGDRTDEMASDMTNKALKALAGRPAWWTSEFEWGLSTCGDYVNWPMAISWTEMGLDPTHETVRLLLGAVWSLGKTVPGERRTLDSQVEDLMTLEYRLQRAQAVTRRRRALMTDPERADEEEAWNRTDLENPPAYVEAAALRLRAADGTSRLLELMVSPEGRIEVTDASEIQPDYETILTLREAFTIVEASVQRQDEDPTDWAPNGGLPQ